MPKPAVKEEQAVGGAPTDIASLSHVRLPLVVEERDAMPWGTMRTRTSPSELLLPLRLTIERDADAVTTFALAVMTTGVFPFASPMFRGTVILPGTGRGRGMRGAGRGRERNLGMARGMRAAGAWDAVKGDPVLVRVRLSRLARSVESMNIWICHLWMSFALFVMALVVPFSSPSCPTSV